MLFVYPDNNLPADVARMGDIRTGARVTLDGCLGTVMVN
jgi:hypothetical protein